MIDNTYMQSNRSGVWSNKQKEKRRVSSKDGGRTWW